MVFLIGYVGVGLVLWILDFWGALAFCVLAARFLGFGLYSVVYLNFAAGICMAVAYFWVCVCCIYGLVWGGCYCLLPLADNVLWIDLLLLFAFAVRLLFYGVGCLATWVLGCVCMLFLVILLWLVDFAWGYWCACVACFVLDVVRLCYIFCLLCCLLWICLCWLSGLVLN